MSLSKFSKLHRKQQRQEVADHLKGLLSGQIKPKDKFSGICNELCDFISYGDSVSELLDLMELWPEGSGVRFSPNA